MRRLSIYKAKFYQNVNNLKMGGVRVSKCRCAIEGIFDFLKYGSTITDYFELSFWKKTAKDNARYATWRTHKRFIFEVDDKLEIEKFANKAVMYQRLSCFLKREQLYTKNMTEQEFIFFCDKHPVFFFKPSGNSCGNGIEKITATDQDLHNLFIRLKENDAVLDTPVIQHQAMASLNNKSVNTLRVFTFRNNGIIYFTGCALRIGLNSFIDNYSAGGLVCSVNMQNGCTKETAENNLGQRFEYHPISHTNLVNFQIPKWNEVLKFVFEMAQQFDLNYVAWDIAITEDSVDLIEANPAGMINLIQIAGGSPKKELLLRLEKAWKSCSHNDSNVYKLEICE